MDPAPRWRRRKEARPCEIEASALAEFAEKGYAAARLENIARQAGVSKAALFVYFPSKADLFRAVVNARAAPDLQAAISAVTAEGLPFRSLAEGLLDRMAAAMSATDMCKLARMVIAESGNFPEVARHWHDALVSKALAAMAEAIEAGQKRGEVRPGEPRLMAMSLVGPMMMGVIWKEVMEPVGGLQIDLRALAREHGRTALYGLLTRPPTEETTCDAE